MLSHWSVVVLSFMVITNSWQLLCCLSWSLLAADSCCVVFHCHYYQQTVVVLSFMVITSSGHIISISSSFNILINFVSNVIIGVTVSIITTGNLHGVDVYRWVVLLEHVCALHSYKYATYGPSGTGWVQLDSGYALRREEAPAWCITDCPLPLLQYFDAVGWVFWPIKPTTESENQLQLGSLSTSSTSIVWQRSTIRQLWATTAALEWCPSQ